ncbi:hypothetical protein [Phyllobacterium myrsinacearum]|uniref:Uncharacterized protein n=1 Tax=Phyllobacterium myrsinacearum TaxID=28101 RepID=A0A839ES60_9HYPH|nr:hypothetical protein [Phyllobacterium myrsinacearum]MBA8881642.1 hypothetical protein [Phyllobacterium myrsinacearum]
MWINFDDKQLEYVKAAMIAFADGNERDAKLFWLEELRDLRERLEQEAKDYRSIAAKIDESKANFDPNDPYLAAAREAANHELEIDEDAAVSPGADPGAWVQAWIWVSNEAAGLDVEDTCRDCLEEYAEGGDGYNGRCPDCADAAEARGDSDD